MNTKLAEIRRRKSEKKGFLADRANVDAGHRAA